MKKIKINRKKLPILFACLAAFLLAPLFSQTAHASNQPSQVTQLKTGATTNSSINLSWKSQSGVSGYEVYRSGCYDGKYVNIATINPQTHAFCNMKLEGGKDYYYKVRAFTKIGGKRVKGSFSVILTANTRSSNAQTATTRYRSNIRKHAGTSQPILATVNSGTRVQIISRSMDKSGKTWLRVSLTWNQKTVQGYIASNLLNSSTTTTKTGIVNTQVLNVRSTAGTNGRILGVLYRGQKVIITETVTNSNGNVWYQISLTRNGKKIVGYVSALFIKQ